jgi:hypothetical protein
MNHFPIVSVLNTRIVITGQGKSDTSHSPSPDNLFIHVAFLLTAGKAWGISQAIIKHQNGNHERENIDCVNKKT